MWLPVALLLLEIAAGEGAIRRAMKVTGSVQLPGGMTEISGEIVLPAGAHDLTIDGGGTVLRLADGFRGRAALVCGTGRNIRFRNFTVDGNRAAVARPAELPPYDVPFARFTVNNGVLAENVEGLRIEDMKFRNIAGFAVLISRSSGVHIERVQVEDSGSRNASKRNNTTGGILLEEGTVQFEVRRCRLARILGNAIWTHSLYPSPRNEQGIIAENEIEEVGRDAIQVGHATGMVVERNTGRRIGYPVEEIDVAGLATPVAIDTGGNVGHSTYRENRFEEVNGKCIDLDGFHDGDVLRNSCINKKGREAYPNGNLAIGLNNSNPDMRSERIRIEGNTIDGWLYGGILLIGSGHTVSGNRLLRLNLAHCNVEAVRFSCLYFANEPEFLRSGIYVRAGNHRKARAEGNRIEGNEITGFGMRGHCVAFGPGVKVRANVVRRNVCADR